MSTVHCVIGAKEKLPSCFAITYVRRSLDIAALIICCFKQCPGLRNLNNRDGKFRATHRKVLIFRATYDNQMIKLISQNLNQTPSCTFSVALVAKNATNCTDLHLYFQKKILG